MKESSNFVDSNEGHGAARYLEAKMRSFHGGSNQKARLGLAIEKRLKWVHERIVMEIGEKYSERKPGVIAATALNKMGKALKLKVHPDAYTSDRWFNWPWCYHPRRPSIMACLGFEKKHIKH